MQKIDNQVFVDAARRLVEQYSSASIKTSEIVAESGVSTRTFYNNVDITELWKQVAEDLADTGWSFSYVYNREKRCNRSQIAKHMEKLSKERVN